MIEPNEMPASLVERATLMQNLLMARATGLSADPEVYEALRREFMANETLNQLLPDFVRTCRSLDVFWPHIQSKSGKYAERRHIIGTAFNALFDNVIAHRSMLPRPRRYRPLTRRGCTRFGKRR